MLAHPGAVMLTALCLSFALINCFELTLPSRGHFLTPHCQCPYLRVFSLEAVAGQKLGEKMMSDTKEVVEVLMLVITQYKLTFCCCCGLLLLASHRARAVTVLEWHLSVPDVDVFSSAGARGWHPDASWVPRNNSGLCCKPTWSCLELSHGEGWLLSWSALLRSVPLLHCGQDCFFPLHWFLDWV